MKLRRLEVRDFRKIRGSLVLDELGDGITIVAGDNEEGKSSLLAALKAAFFDLHTLTGAARQAMTPWATEAVPAVHVDFDLREQRWELRKAFRRGGCTLSCAGTRLEGDAAERRLQELLRFERPGRGPSGPTHQGLASLFWVEQGSSTANLRPTGAVMDRLGEVVAGEVDKVAEGVHGRRIIDKASSEAERFWTPTGGKERAVLVEARAAVERRWSEEQDLRQRIAVIRDKIDRLATLRAQERQRAARDDAGQVRERVRELRERMTGIERLDSERSQAVERLKGAEAEVSRIAGQSRTRAQLHQEIVALQEEQRRIASELSTAAEERELAEVALAEATARERATASELTEATATQQQLVRRQAFEEARRNARRFRSVWERASELEARLREKRLELADYRITPAGSAEIRVAASARMAARAALEAAATRIELRPEPGQIVEIDGRQVEHAGSLRLVERTELCLGDFGHMVVLPGGDDLATRRARLTDAERKLELLLANAEVSEPHEADSLLDARQSCAAELEATAKVLAAVLAAETVSSVAELQDRLTAVERHSDEQFADRGSGEVEPSVADQATIAAAERRVDELRRAVEERRSALAMAEQRVAAVATRSAILDARESDLEQARERVAARLERERDERADDALERALAAASEQRLSAVGALEQVERQLRVADGERVRQELEQAIRTEIATESDAASFDQRLREAVVEARVMGSESLGERLAEVVSERELAERSLRRLLVEARAWRMLKEELMSQEQQLRLTWALPVRKRLLPLLSRVLPGADPIVDPDALTLSHLQRAAIDEPFEALSLGTREQVAILVRIALAQLVAAREGEAPCLVLDDALVYADEGRLAAMLGVLARAAAELQILILTCRPHDFLGLEARRVSLRDCVTDDRSQSKLVLPPR